MKTTITIIFLLFGVGVLAQPKPTIRPFKNMANQDGFMLSVDSADYHRSWEVYLSHYAPTEQIDSALNTLFVRYYRWWHGVLLEQRNQQRLDSIINSKLQ